MKSNVSNVLVLMLYLLLFAVVTMSEYLELPTWDGTVVSKGDPLPDDHQRVDRTTAPLGVGQLIPLKTDAQKQVEEEDEDVAAARREKERKKLEKQPREKRAVTSTSAPRKRRKKIAGGTETISVSSNEAPLDVDPLNVEVQNLGAGGAGENMPGGGGGVEEPRKDGQEALNVD